MVLEVDDEAVEPVRDRGAGRTAGRVLGPKHEVVHQELRTPFEEVCERGRPVVRLEAVVLLDPDPGELLALPGQLVAPAGQLLLGSEQLEPRRKPFLTRSGRVLLSVAYIESRC
jgi:hypothetical protein